jgi:hypothetical protein
VNPGEQARQVRPILFFHCSKLEPDSLAGDGVPDDGIRPDLPFLHKKMKTHGNPRSLGFRSFEEKTSQADIVDAGQIVMSIAAPINPDFFWHLDSRSNSSGRGGLHFHGLALRMLWVRNGERCSEVKSFT